MMAVDLFSELERGHEAKYKLDQEQRFKAQCREAKLLGRWAATRLGLPTAAADAYAKRMVGVALGPEGVTAVRATIGDDLARAGLAVTSSDIDRAVARCRDEALASLAAEYPMPLGPDHVRVGD